MPIVVTSPAPDTAFGWGFQLQVSSDFIGPILDPVWRFILRDTPTEREFFRLVSNTQGPGWAFAGPLKNQTTAPVPVNLPPEGANVNLEVQLGSGVSGTVESSIVNLKMDWQTGQIQGLSSVIGSNGALTEEQSLQLSETHASTFPAISLDALTLSELTNGPQGGFVAADLALWIFGVIIRISSVPPEYRVDTADGLYWVRSLAVVRIYRGSDLWKRVPVHTESKLISFVEEGLVVAVASITSLQWLAQISVQVNFAEGVLGQVFLMRAP